MTLKAILFFCLNLGPVMAFGQERVVVNDPSIQFSYDKPSGWEIKDDGYTYQLHAPGNADAYVSFTYVQGPQGNDYVSSLGDTPAFEEDFNFELQYNVAEGVEGFKVIEKGKVQIDGTTALWAKFKSETGEGNLIHYFYMYPRLGQQFKITTTAPEATAESIQKDFMEIIKSFKAKRR